MTAQQVVSNRMDPILKRIGVAFGVESVCGDGVSGMLHRQLGTRATGNEGNWEFGQLGIDQVGIATRSR